MKLTWPLLSMFLGACTGASGNDSQELESATAELRSPRCWQRTLAWGNADSEVGLVPRGYEQVARGPQALAVSKSGEVFVLDSVNGRVLALTSAGTRIAVNAVAPDAEDLAVGSDGALAVHSPFQARAWVFDADGSPAGEVEIPRSLSSLVGLSLGASRQLIVHSAYQENFSVGSAAVAKNLPTILSQKREGAFAMNDGRGISVRVSEGVAELLVLRSTRGDNVRTEVSSRVAIPSYVSGANLIGVSGTIACLRLEQVEQPGDELVVHRRNYCVDTGTGEALIDNPMTDAAVYRPRHELALGGDTPMLASLQPTNDGLQVVACEVLR